jgi:hypothetical protein
LGRERSVYVIVGLVLGVAAVLAGSVLSPDYRHSLNTQNSTGDARLYANLVAGSLVTGVALIPLKAWKRLAALAHIAFTIALTAYVVRPLVLHSVSGSAAICNLSLLGVLLLTGGYLYLKPRRTWRRSFRPLRNLHLALAIGYVAKFIAEPFIGAVLA